jgi:hypothetical protein
VTDAKRAKVLGDPGDPGPEDLSSVQDGDMAVLTVGAMPFCCFTCYHDPP